MRECDDLSDDGFVVGDGSLWVHVMSVEYRNAVGKVAYTGYPLLHDLSGVCLPVWG